MNADLVIGVDCSTTAAKAVVWDRQHNFRIHIGPLDYGSFESLLPAGAVLPVVQLDKRINPQKVVDIVFSGRSIDTSTLFFTPEEQQANAEAEQAHARLQSGGHAGKVVLTTGS